MIYRRRRSQESRKTRHDCIEGTDPKRAWAHSFFPSVLGTWTRAQINNRIKNFTSRQCSLCMWTLTAVCNTPNYTHTLIHTHNDERDVNSTPQHRSASQPWAGRQRPPLHAAPHEQLPLKWSRCSITWGYWACSWAWGRARENRHLLCFATGRAPVLLRVLVTSGWCGKWSHDCFAAHLLPRFGALWFILAQIFLAC